MAQPIDLGHSKWTRGSRSGDRPGLPPPQRDLLPNDEVYLDLIDEMSPGVIKINSPFLYVLMPMRIS